MIDGQIISIAANTELIVVGKDFDQPGHQIMVFEVVSGSLVRSFGERGRGPGQVDGCYGIRFTLNGVSILIADLCNHRISDWTIGGELLRNVGMA